MSEPVFQEAALSPLEVLAGDSVTFEVRLVIGPGYTPGPSRLVFDLPTMLGASRPSDLHGEGDGFFEAFVDAADVTYAARVWNVEKDEWSVPAHGRSTKMADRFLVLDLSAGLRAGETVRLQWGVGGRGFSPGTKVTTVAPTPDYRQRIDVRYFADPDRALPDFCRDFAAYRRPRPDDEVSLAFRVLPREPATLRLLRRQDRAQLLAHDRFWNLCDGCRADELIECSAPAAETSPGVWDFAGKDVRVVSRGLPLLEAPPMDDVFEGLNVYWGDVHGHSTFSIDCIEREKMLMTPGDLMAFARDRAGVDFCAVADHHQPWDLPRRRLDRPSWEQTIDAVDGHHEPGRFVVFPAIEFRCPRGDTVVVFAQAPGHDQIAREDWRDVRGLWRSFPADGFVTIPHFHNPGALSEGEWWANVESGVETTLEIFSCHGSYECQRPLEQARTALKHFRRDRCAAYFLAKGYKYGLGCNSDGHKGHMGTNGLTAVYAPRLDRESILEGYRKRRIYGTTNARIRLLFTGNGRLMGSAVPNEPRKTLRIDVTGESALKKVDLFRNGRHDRRFAADGRTFVEEVEIDDAEPAHWYVRVTQRDNQVAWSSPIWFEDEPSGG
jgi:hypothetical protein